MTDGTVALLDHGTTELHEAVSKANGFWDDSRRDSTERRYLLPHGEVDDRLHAQLAAVLDASDQATAAARDADLAVAAARQEEEHGQRHFIEAGARLTETRTATDEAGRAEAAATYVYNSALQLVERANALAP